MHFMEIMSRGWNPDRICIKLVYSGQSGPGVPNLFKSEGQDSYPCVDEGPSLSHPPISFISLFLISNY